MNLKAGLLTILVFNYAVNSTILSGRFEYFNQIPITTTIVFLLSFFLLFIFLSYLFNVRSIEKRVDLFSILFILFSILKFKDINPEYYWNSIPDSRTYKQLGEGLLECFRLTVNCDSVSHLEFAIGQPLISGVLSRYFYNFSYLIHIFMIAFVIYTITKISKQVYKFTTGLGVFFLLSQSLIFELTPMMISEVTFTFFIFIILNLYFSKYKWKEYLIPAIYGFSLLIRPVGVALFPIFSFIFRKKFLTFIIFFIVLLLAALFNLVTAGEFIISDFNIDSRQDGLFENSGYTNYLFKLIFSDNNTKASFIEFVYDNYSRLYGESSRDCTFEKTCIFFNPKYNQDGTKSSFFINSRVGSLFETYLSLFFDLRAPQRIGLLVFPFVILFPYVYRDFKIERILSMSIVFLITPSLLTAEFGSRWSFTILFISCLIIEMTSSNIVNKMKNK